jgi:seryl-tRNA synthetase
MLDIKFIRENAELIKDGARKKHLTFDVAELIRLDDERKVLLAKVEAGRAEQNTASLAITNETDAAKRNAKIAEMKTLKATIEHDEKALEKVMHDWQLLMVQVPNIPDMSVPEGGSDAENVEVKQWGTPPKFSFTPKSHIELMEQSDMVDFERGGKVAGFRGYILKNDAVVLNFALWQFVFNHFLKKGFQPIMVPSLVKRETLLGTGYLPQGEDDLYKTQDSEYLAGTGEVATMGYYMDEVVPKEKLPVKFLAFSPCFRREAGSHGKDTKGIMRVHEFFKFEQVVLCEATHETSVKFHEELTRNSEEMLEALGLPYHVVVNCGGDLGLGQVKKYDIEVWVPSEGKYRETHSSSYFHDFQTRRLNTRYRDTDGKLRFTHSLNNTAAATPRLLISILENNQQADGTIKVPEVLVSYVGKTVLGTPRV